MSTIKPLRRSVHSLVRSGIVLFDLTRIAEELVFNSLDAGARKVSVFISIGTFSLKVVDDGSGVSRDGLVLLGERYSTSKHCHSSEDKDTVSGSFGSRGEALASISDVSLLEIITKTRGSPNGYRKVLKGCKCLHLRIDDGIKDVGTTVVAREIFYNQPIRRKYIQSSPRKVLDSVKKFILRIALVHSQISFKVFDIESGDTLLCTDPSLSPLSLLISNFGTDISSSLRELNVCEGILTLKGYLSGPCDGFKALQYVYINSQFICKGPIHKLVNGIAAAFECSNSWSCSWISQNGKRGRSQACPAYLLKLNCPRSLYDMNFEPSKTYVEFKDWTPVLTFVEKAVRLFWKENVAEVEIVEQDAGQNPLPPAKVGSSSGNFESGKKRCRFKSEYRLASPLPYVVGAEVNQFVGGEQREIHMQNCGSSIRKFGEDLKEIGSVIDSNCFSDREHTSHVECISSGIVGGDICNWESDNNFRVNGDSFLHVEEDFFKSNSFVERGAGNDSRFLSSTWKDECHDVNFVVCEELEPSELSSDGLEFGNEVKTSAERKEPFLQSCSMREKLLLSRVNVARDGGSIAPFESDRDFSYRSGNSAVIRKQIQLEDDFQLHKLSSDGDLGFHSNNYKMEPKFFPEVAVHFGEFHCSNERFDLFPELSCQDEAFDVQSLSKCMATGNMFIDVDLPSVSSLKSTIQCPMPSVKENHLSTICITGIQDASSGGQSMESDHVCVTSDFSQDDTSLDAKSHMDNIPLESSSRYTKRPRYEHPANETGWKLRAMGRSKDRHCCNGTKQKHCSSEKARRSHSAPPFYRQKRRFISLSDLQMEDAWKSDAREFFSAFSRPDGEVKRTTAMHSCTHNLEIPNPKSLDVGTNFGVDLTTTEVDKVFVGEAQDSRNGEKCREGYLQKSSKSFGSHSQSNILDISSGFLHLAGDSLVPKSITKNCLENAKVLQQVDKKFIPVVADGIVAIIDQSREVLHFSMQALINRGTGMPTSKHTIWPNLHAADERIQLEDLRQKVLSGEGKTIMYLDSAKELVIPEMGHQLLHDYAEEIKGWGWICNIHSQCSRPFRKNLDIILRQQNTVTLVAVPCILGVNLTDVDLLEFLQQLVETDGASTMPPAVLRVLNSKACRGAIMFGDSLLPSECSLIVEELKQTSLCFQCAHGRPTTVPLLNLKALHKQMSKLCVVDDTWHGLRRHELSLERSAERLKRSL